MTPLLPFGSATSRRQLGWLMMAVVWATVTACAAHNAVLGDEWVHWHQVDRFLRGDFRVFDEWLTNIPGYHWAMTLLMTLLRADELAVARLVNSVFGLICAWTFHRIRLVVHPLDAQRALAQFVFLPILFPFFFLVYTDVLSLMFVLLALLATLRGRHGWAALGMLAAMSVRQNNVLWVGFLALLVLLPVWRDAGWKPWLVARQSLRLAWPYALAVVAFLGYWAWNGSISYSNAQATVAHPDVRLDAGNPYFLLFLVGLLFPFQVAAGIHRWMADPAATWRWGVPVLVFAGFAVAFEVRHPYNLIPGDVFLRNSLLRLVSQDAWAWFGFGALATLAACGLLGARFAWPYAGLLVPSSLLFVGASWLIEQRYAIIPLALFLALRRPEGDAVERVTVALWAPFAVWVAIGMLDHRFVL